MLGRRGEKRGKRSKKIIHSTDSSTEQRKTLFDMQVVKFRINFLTVTCAVVLLVSKITLAEVKENRLSPVVQTESGAVVGTVENLPYGKTAHQYLGIPYAEPPVGDLRFADPKPVKPWPGIKRATEFGASCMQSLLPIPDAPTGNVCVCMMSTK